MDEKFLKKRIKDFTWYTPVDFGNGVIAEGDFKISTSINSFHFGLGKWKYIIERNLPDLQGKRVMDIGCNAGLFCIQMARMGAKEVIGIDSDRTWPKWIEQAMFVKEALEWRCNTKYPITYLRVPFFIGRYLFPITLQNVTQIFKKSNKLMKKTVKQSSEHLLIWKNRYVQE